MRLLLLTALSLSLSLLLAACSQSQPGCTAENCQLMVSACRVEFQGGPADLAICVGFDRPPSPPDFTRYCVDACNAQPGNGALAACIASRADACRDGGVTPELAIQPCLDQQPPTKEPDPTCADGCTAKRRTCDDACSGGKPCDSCLRAGRSDCASFCTDAGYQSCLDCSAQCGLQFIACSNACPRVP